ncbi:MAG TPA: permease-like cell division protein FtsX [Pseudomonas sp.]|jgi:cell division transport system permease protein|nr:permease-like cell division protein FtsX [Pseudomonas sp.]
MNAPRQPNLRSAGRGATRRVEPSAGKPVRRGPSLSSQLHSWLDSHRASLRDSLGRLWQQPFGSFFTCLVMAIALSLPMGLALLLDNVERLSGTWQHAARISVFLEMNVSDAEGQALRDDIAGMPQVQRADWISRDQALTEFQAVSGLAETLRELPDNPLPGSVLVTPGSVDKAELESLRQRLAELPGVELAQLDLLWVERLGAILALSDRFLFGVTVLLVLTLLLVIGNTIRLHIENRRREIEVIKLVGGTDGYVRRPFLYLGALYGLGAGLLAWAVLAFGLAWLNSAVVRLAGLYDSDFSLIGVPWADGVSLVFGALLLGYIGAWLAVARHLRELAPR